MTTPLPIVTEKMAALAVAVVALTASRELARQVKARTAARREVAPISAEAGVVVPRLLVAHLLATVTAAVRAVTVQAAALPGRQQLARAAVVVVPVAVLPLEPLAAVVVVLVDQTDQPGQMAQQTSAAVAVVVVVVVALAVLVAPVAPV